MVENKWIEYKGKQVFLEAYDSSDIEAIINGVMETTDAIINSGKKDILLLTDVTNMPEAEKLYEIFKEAGKIQQGFVKKEGVVGLSALKKLALIAMAGTLSCELKPFGSREEALEWLIKD